MPLNSGSPIIGRLFKDGLGFLSSTCGLPVAESIGSRSQTTTPQIPAPHLLTRTLASPACVSQMPVTSPPAWACAPGTASSAVNSAMMKPNRQAMEFSAKAGVHSNKSNFGNAVKKVMRGSLAPARQANRQGRGKAEHDHRRADQGEQGPGRG